MYNSLSCVVKGTVDATAYGGLFGTVCGYGGGSACAGFAGKPITGQYGAYSMCNATEELSFAFNQYYLSQNSQASACNYQGAAAVKGGVTPSGTCAALINQVGAAGTGTVTATAGLATSSAAKKGGAPSQTGGVSLLMSLYIIAATSVGAGLILL
jgi:hypothetical protein